MEFEIVITEKAQQDAEEAHQWINSQSPDAGLRWFRRLLASIETLKFHPNRCAEAPESTYFDDLEIRQYIFGKRSGTYRILFIVQGSTVIVLRIRHAAREMLDIEDVDP